jgi:hypothetical protein
MEKTKGDEHLHHPMCEFSDTHELSVHIKEAHGNEGN